MFPDNDLHLETQPSSEGGLGDCKMKATKDELKDVFGINLTETKGYALFFFDGFYNLQGVRNTFHPAHDSKMKKHFQDVSLFNALPKYHVKVNSKGMRPQKM